MKKNESQKVSNNLIVVEGIDLGNMKKMKHDESC